MGMTAVLWLLVSQQPVIAQDVQHRLPAFQDPASDSLQTEILNRIAVTGQYEADDLPRLARLAVLQSISMLSNVQADLRGSLIGDRLEREVTAFWDATAGFSEVVGSAPLDMTTLNSAQTESVQMAAAYRQLEATMGEFPGVSPRAASHLQDITRLLSATNSVMGAEEANLLRTMPGQVDPSLDLDLMRSQAQALANELVILIGNVRDSHRGKAATDGVLEDLNGMLAQVQEFARTISLQPSFKNLRESFRAARRRMWHVEARILQLDWPPDLRRGLRNVRDRTNAIADDFGLPRTIVLSPRAARAAGSSHKLVAQVDRSLAWLDEYLAGFVRELRRTPAGSRFEADVVKMRRQLIEMRRRAIANESTERLTQALQEIELTSQQLTKRASALDGVRRDEVIARFQNPAQAVAKLRGLIAQR